MTVQPAANSYIGRSTNTERIMMSRVTRRALRAAMVGSATAAVAAIAACDRAAATEPQAKTPAARQSDLIVDDTTGQTCRSGWEWNGGRWTCTDP